MSFGYNKVMLIGNTTDEPVIRSTGNGGNVANFTLACNESRKGPDGNYTEFAEFVRVAVFGKTADVIKQYLHKGGKVHVEGKIRTRQYEKDGVKHYSTEVVADPGGVILLGGGNGQQKPQGAQRQGQGQGAWGQHPQYAGSQYQPAQPQAAAPQYGQIQPGYGQAPAPQGYGQAPQGGAAPADDIPF